MKKLITIILILAMLLPAVTLAEENKEIDYYGGYAHIEISKDDTPIMYVIYFAEDYKCYFLAQAFDSKRPTIGRAFVGNWGYTSDGEVHAVTGENTEITFHITSFGDIVDKETMQVYEYFSGLYH